VGTAADSDVNDPNAPFVPNDTVANPQDIPNPVIVGGYVNQPGQGAPGRSRFIGDASDIYRISLVEGQPITLIIGDISPPNDLDLFLADHNGRLVRSSESNGNRESIISPVTGIYLIEVFAAAGASNYVLTVGQNVTTAGTDKLSVLDDFVPGDIVVRFADVHSEKTRSVISLASKASAFGLTAKAGAVDRQALLSLGNPAQKLKAMQMLNISGPDKRQPVLMQKANIDPNKMETIRAVKSLRQRADIKYAEPNYIYRSLLVVPDDEFYPLQWHYPMINLPQAWEISTGHSDITLAVIDTGVILAHPDLQGRLVQGYDFVRDEFSSRDGDGIDNDPDDPGDSLAPGSSTFHGTHVAGTIGGATDNSAGVSGVTWATAIMPLRAVGYLGAGTSYDIAQAVRYAAGLSNDSGTLPANRADVINLSLGGPGFSQADQDLYAEVRKQGVIVVAAAGNNNSSAPSYPASYSGVVSVSAVDINKDKATYSNFGPHVDVAAPGGDATPDVNGDGFPDAVLLPF
jgi:serine protease